MNTENTNLPVPFISNFSVPPKTECFSNGGAYVFLFLFALYLLSTLLGSAVVSGRLELNSATLALQITSGGAFLCTERCFLALFSVIIGFTFLKFLFAPCFALICGILTGVCVTVLLYGGSVGVSVLLAAFFSLQIIFDILFYWYIICSNPVKNGKITVRTFSFQFISLFVYSFVTYFLSLVIAFLLK